MTAIIDSDDAFDNSGYVDGAVELPAQWSIEADTWRTALAAHQRVQLDQQYGPAAREVFDLFSPENKPEGTLVFVHGGYWYRLDKSYWSHFASGCLSHGWAVAIASYPLAPDVRLTKITDSIRQCVEHIATITDGAIVLAGHSAGGHLVSRMICSGVLSQAVLARINRVVAVSGVYHLNPLLNTAMRDKLQLTESEVMTESPVHLESVTTVPVTFMVGDHERPEFLRQTRMVAECWSAKGVPVRTIYEPGLDHFNVINSLQDNNGTLTREIVQV